MSHSIDQEKAHNATSKLPKADKKETAFRANEEQSNQGNLRKMPFSFSGQVTASELLAGNPHLKRCARCDLPLNKRDIPLDLEKKPSGYPLVSKTPDGFTLVSPAFRKRYDEEGWHGLEFGDLSCGYFTIWPTRAVRVVADIRHTYDSDEYMTGVYLELLARDRNAPRSRPATMEITLTDHCPDCGHYTNTYANGHPTIRRGELPVAELEFVRTDIECGPGDLLSPRFIVGDGIRKSFLKKKLTRTSVFPRIDVEGWA